MKEIVRKRFRWARSGFGGRARLRSGQAGPKGRTVGEKNVGKGRKEWRRFAEVDKEKEDGDEDRTDDEATMRDPDRGEAAR